MQSYLNYLLDRPHTDEQMQSLTNNTSVMLTAPHHWYHCLSFWFSLYIPLMYYTSRLTPHHCFTLFVYSIAATFPQRYEHHISYLFSDRTSPGEPYVLIDTRSSWHRFLATHVLLKHGLGWVWLSFMAQVVFQHRHRWQRVVERHIFAPPHMLCSLFRLLPPCHSAQVPSLTYHINF